MIVDELTRLRVLAVALGLRANGPNHLRVAVVATFPDVDISTHELEGSVRRDRCDSRNIGFDQEGRYDLQERSDDHRHSHPNAELQWLSFPNAVPLGLHEVDQRVPGVRDRAVLRNRKLDV